MVDDISLIQEATVSRTQILFAAAIAVVLVIAGVVATPFANIPLVAAPGYVPAFGAAMLVVNLLLAAMFFTKGNIGHRGDAVLLGDAFLYVALIFIPLIAAFPGALTIGSLIGAPNSAAWLWSFWHVGFALAILRYARASWRADAAPVPVKKSIVGVLAIAIFLSLIATFGLRFLPSMFANDPVFFSGNRSIAVISVLAINVAALVSVARLRARTPEQLWLTVGMTAACVDIWLTINGSNQYALGWYFAKLASLLTSLFLLISNFHGLTVLYRHVAETNNLLLTLADKDGLTGLLNRRSFDEILDKEWQRAQREESPLALLIIDIDFFKKYNDLYGHLAGDDCLRKVAEQMQDVVQRPGDVICRFGGEEFAVILPNTENCGASRVAHRILVNINALALPHAQNPPHQVVSASIGIASAIPTAGLAIPDLISAADRALYQAKAAGRNQAQLGDCSVPTDNVHALG